MKQKILIVEDEILIAMDLQARLEEIGYDVPATADSAESALAFAHSCAPDLILMDIRLRGAKDGIQAATEVREQLSIPVIFLTSHSDAETVERAKSSEPFGYIVKPFGSIDFRVMIEMAIQKHATERALRSSLRWHTTHEKARLLRLFHDTSPSLNPDGPEIEPPSRHMAFEQAVLEAVPDAGLLVDHDGIIILANTQAVRLFGYEQEEIKGQSIRIVLPEELGTFIGPVGESTTDEHLSEIPAARRCRCLHKDGQDLQVEISLSLLTTQEGQKVLSFYRDTSERHVASSDNRHFASIVDSTQCAIFSQSSDGIITTWNRGAARLFGYSADEIIGYPSSVLLPSSLMDTVPSMVAGQGPSAFFLQEDTVRRRSDGRLIDVTQIVSPLRNESGTVVGQTIAAMDVSEHVRGEDRFRGLLEASPDAIVVFDQVGRIVLANARVEKLFGHSREELLDHSDDMLVPKRFWNHGAGFSSGLLAGSGSSVMGEAHEFCCLRKDGQEFPVEVTFGQLDTKEGTLISATIRDITERKVAEEKMRRALEEKDVMLNEIHHRVKNNLQIVSSILNMQSAQAQDPVSRGMFADCQNRIQSMALIHQHLYLASNFAEIDFALYLRSLTGQLLASYTTERTVVKVQIGECAGSLNLAEAIPCGLIVNELFSNSLKHSFEGRQAGEIRVGFRTADGKCILTVDDNGSPLPWDLLSQQKGKMGLRLVQALTAQLGGTLRINGQAKFTVTFPQKAASVS